LVDKIGETGEAIAQSVREKAVNSQVVLGKFGDLVFEVGTDKKTVRIRETNLSEFSLVYLRRVGHRYFSTAGTLALFLQKEKIKFFDRRFAEIGPAGDKFTSLSKLAFAGISVPQTVFLMKENLEKNSSELINFLNLPLIAKEYALQRNQGIFMIRSKADFTQLLAMEIWGKESQFLFQKFINIEKEYRLLVLGDKVAVAHTKAVRDYQGFRVVDNTPENNVTFIDPRQISEEMKSEAVTAARVLNTEIAGVDVCQEKKTGNVYVIEVNRGPGFFTDRNFSPELTEVADFLIREAKRPNDQHQ